MANTSAIWQQAAPTNYHLLAAQQEPYKKAYPLTKNIWSFLGEKESGEWTISRKMTRQKEQKDWAEKNKRGDRKGESNDSPETPDRRITSDIPGLPSGCRQECNTTPYRHECNTLTDKSVTLPLTDRSVTSPLADRRIILILADRNVILPLTDRSVTQSLTHTDRT